MANKILPANAKGIALGANALKQGKLVGFPTETVYGLGARADDDMAVAKIFEAKGRPAFNPLIIHVADHRAAKEFGVFNHDAQLLAGRFWPGALSLVVPRAKNCPISLLATAGLDSIALRVPADAIAQTLLQKSGFPIAAPSANKSGRISATEARHVAEDLGENIEIVLDGGATPIGIESTIIACIDDQTYLLRSGAVTIEDIEEALGHPLKTPTETKQTPQAPGGLKSHYAPKALLRLNAKDIKPDEALLGFGVDMPPGGKAVLNLSEQGDLVEAAANLFAYLRELDGQAHAIAVMPIPSIGLGDAINDRLKRAAAPRD